MILSLHFHLPSIFSEDIIANVIGKWNQVMRFQPAIYELLLHENIKYMLQQTRDLLVILHAREFSVVRFVSYRLCMMMTSKSILL
jgi:hypothetical protein